MPRWSEKQSCTFVSLYKEFDCLWNVFDPSYKNRDMRLAAFDYIVKVMNIPTFTVNDVPKKIRSFRSTYNQELLKVVNSQENGAGNDVYYPTVKWFDDMDYIMKNSNVNDRPTITDIVSTQLNALLLNIVFLTLDLVKVSFLNVFSPLAKDSFGMKSLHILWCLLKIIIS